MNIHSVPTTTAVSAPTDKRTAILDAATVVFAKRGFFGAQVADIARGAGIAAGTVYLYFKSKDEILTSLFDRTMREAIGEGRAALADVDDPVERLRRIAHMHLARMGRDRNLAIVFQVELRQTTKFMERFSTTGLRDYLGVIQQTIEDAPEARALPQIVRREDRHQGVLRRTRRDGDQLDPQPAPLRARRPGRRDRRHPRRRLRHAGERDAVIHSAAVLGAGTMGAQIAAHLANAGLPVLLLDVTADAAKAGLERARKTRPDPFFLPETAAAIRTGSFDDDLAEAGKADWIIEAIVEKLDAKHTLLGRLAPHLTPRSIVSTNTSGIPIHQVAQAFTSASHRARFLGTHFFNPPRYLPLVEMIPTADTDPAVAAELRAFLDHRLGKGVVVAHDRPGFIANRIGVYGMARTLELVADGRYSIDEVDALTGVAIGRPKSATFRTADIAGLDILAKVASDLETNLKEEAFRMPPFVEAMVGEGAIGEKAGRGFFQKVKSADGFRDPRARSRCPVRMCRAPRRSSRLSRPPAPSRMLLRV